MVDGPEDSESPESGRNRTGRKPRPSLILFLPLLAMAFLLSLYPRLDQYRTFSASRDGTAEELAPPGSTDSYYWYRLAREARAGVDFDEPDRLRLFPDGAPYERLPAISWAIATTADLLGTDVYRSGLLLSMLLSSLFVIPLALYGWQAGFPAAGILGALLASFSASIFFRTYIFRVDTDGGNLFFVWLIALFMAGLQPATKSTRRLVHASAAGLAVNGFCLWYAQPAFWLLYLATFALIVLTLRIPYRESLTLIGLYLVCSNPFNLVASFEGLWFFLSEYLLADSGDGLRAATGTLSFPDVTAEIQELARFGFWRSLRGIILQPFLAILGLVGFAAFAVMHWRRALPLAPIVLLSGLGFVWASRMLMYAAPLVTFGLGFSLTFMIGAAWALLPERDRDARQAEMLTYVLLGVFLIGSLGVTSFRGRPNPSVGSDFVESLERMRPLLRPGAAIVTPWSYGYAVTDVTRAATFDDGRDPDDMVQQLIARGLASDDPSELAEIVEYLSLEGREGLRRRVEASESYPEFLSAIRGVARASAETTAPLYVLFTERMLFRESAEIYNKGNWDFAKNVGHRDGFEVTQCRWASERRLACRSRGSGAIEIDLDTGMMNGRPLMRRLLRTRTGEVTWEREYAADGALSVETLENEFDGTVTALLVREAVYRSNFNQMFVLGRIDEALFAELHNDFPVTRSFELRLRSSH